MRSRPMAIKLLLEQPMGLILIHGESCWDRTRRHQFLEKRPGRNRGVNDDEMAILLVEHSKAWVGPLFLPRPW